MTDQIPDDLEFAERIAKVRREFLEGDRRAQEIALAPWQLVTGALGAGAALMAAAVALVAFISGHHP